MLLRFAALLFLCAGLQTLCAQNEIVRQATQLIVDKRYEEAHRYLDSLLRADSNNVDARMMQGNVILNRDLENTAPLMHPDADDESIYTAGIGALQHPVKLVADSTLQKVAQLWQQCLDIDSARTDILQGLCVLYSMALQKEKLKAELLQLVKAVGNEDGELAFRLADYARKIKERGQFAAAMEVYQFIARLFPQLAGIRADIASEYFYHGDLTLALQWLDSAFAQPNVDETTYLNGAFIYSELSYFDNAQKALDAYSKKYDRKMNLFYFGLHRFSESSAEATEALNYFLEIVDSNAYYTEWKLAENLLACKDSFTLKNYLALVQSDLPDYYKSLIHWRGVRQFKTDCSPYLYYGIFENNLKNYAASVQFFDEGTSCSLDSALLPYWQLNYGYALFRTGQYVQAQLLLQPLLNSPSDFRRQAAQYFSAKIYQALHAPEKARQMLTLLAQSNRPGKYVTLAQLLLNQQ